MMDSHGRPEPAVSLFGQIDRAGWLKVAGRDRLDLLQRLSTNDLRLLKSGDGLPTVLTSPIGRVIALVYVYEDEGETAFLRTQPGQAQAVTRYLQSMIFWQDQVTVVDQSSAVAQFAILGDAFAAIQDLLEPATPPRQDPYAHFTVAIGAGPVTLLHGGPLDPYDWSLVVPVERAPEVRAHLAGAMVEASGDELDLHRIERGLPLWGRELSDQVTPLETGLLPAVSFSKGCYTGQEVIARQTNYDKVTRNLVGLRLEPGTPLDLAGAHVEGPGKGGFVGSVARSDTGGGTIALAVVPRDQAVPGTTVTVTSEAGPLQATVTALPFE